MIISGHQRVRACRELNKATIPCMIKHYDNENKEDVIHEDLISTNILQRGIGNINSIKMARCIVELERIYGIRQGSAGKVGILDGNNFRPTTQDQLADQLKIDDRQIRNYKTLLSLIPELQDMVGQSYHQRNRKNCLNKLEKKIKKTLLLRFVCESILFLFLTVSTHP